MTETSKAKKYWCATHGEIDASKAITYETTKGPRAQCPVCKSFLSSTPPSERMRVDAGRRGIVPSKNSADLPNHYCGKCGNVGQNIRIVPSKSGILKVCQACGSTVAEITDDLLNQLPPPPDEEPVFPDEPEGLAVPGGPGLDFTDVEAGRLQEVLSHSGVPSKRLSFILRVFQGTPAYRNPESLFAFLNSMGLGSARSKVASDYVFASGVGSNMGMQAVQVARPEDSMEDEIMKSVILKKKLDILGVNAQGQPLQAQAQGMSPDYENGMKMAIALLGKGQDAPTIEDEVKRLRAIQSLTTTTPADAETAKIMGQVEIAKLDYENKKEMALAKLADERSQAERTQATIDGAVKVGMDVVEKLAEPLGATLAQGVKNLGQGQQQQGPTPADQLSSEDRAEILQKIEQARAQLDAREREVQSIGAPSVQMERVEVMREKNGHMDVHEEGGK